MPPSPFILASASPRRRELLAAAGFNFEVVVADVDETPLTGEAPDAYVRRVAAAKARAVAARHPGRWVLGADTAVVVDGDVLGKPLDAPDATRMLRRLSGRAHQVLTGVAVDGPGGRAAHVAATTVWMRDLTAGEVAAYVASGEPGDKAGAYAIQGRASRFIPRIDGEYSNVVGLPISVVAALLADLGVVSSLQ